MMRLLLVLYLLVIASASNSEPIKVRSGQHDDFSRLVVDFKYRHPWVMETTGNGFEIVFPNQQVHLDFSEIDQKLSINPISQVSSKILENKTIVEFECNCQAKAFWAGHAMFVIDVQETPDISPINDMKIPDIAGSDVATELIKHTSFMKHETSEVSHQVLNRITSAAMQNIVVPRRSTHFTDMVLPDFDVHNHNVSTSSIMEMRDPSPTCFELLDYPKKDDYVELRSELLASTFDSLIQPIQIQLKKLVVFYIEHGFLNEAVLILETEIEPSEFKTYALDLVRAIGANQTYPINEVKNYSRCSDHHFIWSVARDPEHVLQSESATKRAIGLLFGYPMYFREKVAEKILQKIGYRIDPVHENALNLLLENASNKKMQSTVPDQITQLAERLHSQIDQSMPLKKEDMILLESYIFEMASDDGATGLHLLFFQALAYQGLYRKALEIAEAEGMFDAMPIVYETALAQPEEDHHLRIALEISSEMFSKISTDAKISVLDVLNSFGFVEKAKELRPQFNDTIRVSAQKDGSAHVQSKQHLGNSLTKIRGAYKSIKSESTDSAYQDAFINLERSKRLRNSIDPFLQSLDHL